jgi:hypothetical protein
MVHPSQPTCWSRARRALQAVEAEVGRLQAAIRSLSPLAEQRSALAEELAAVQRRAGVTAGTALLPQPPHAARGGGGGEDSAGGGGLAPSEPLPLPLPRGPHAPHSSGSGGGAFDGPLGRGAFDGPLGRGALAGLPPQAPWPGPDGGGMAGAERLEPAAPLPGDAAAAAGGLDAAAAVASLAQQRGALAAEVEALRSQVRALGGPRGPSLGECLTALGLPSLPFSVGRAASCARHGDHQPRPSRSAVCANQVADVAALREQRDHLLEVEAEVVALMEAMPALAPAAEMLPALRAEHARLTAAAAEAQALREGVRSAALAAQLLSAMQAAGVAAEAAGGEASARESEAGSAASPREERGEEARARAPAGPAEAAPHAGEGGDTSPSASGREAELDSQPGRSHAKAGGEGGAGADAGELLMSLLGRLREAEAGRGALSAENVQLRDTIASLREQLENSAAALGRLRGVADALSAMQRRG